MISAELQASLRQLSKAEKLGLIQQLAAEVAEEASGPLTAQAAYPVWSPYDAFAAEDTLLGLLAQEPPRIADA